MLLLLLGLCCLLCVAGCLAFQLRLAVSISFLVLLDKACSSRIFAHPTCPEHWHSVSWPPTALSLLSSLGPCCWDAGWLRSFVVSHHNFMLLLFASVLGFLMYIISFRAILTARDTLFVLFPRPITCFLSLVALLPTVSPFSSMTPFYHPALIF